MNDEIKPANAAEQTEAAKPKKAAARKAKEPRIRIVKACAVRGEPVEKGILRVSREISEQDARALVRMGRAIELEDDK